jgi:quinol-cytochrome oxidoreductase complex cytochrome b subunit
MGTENNEDMDKKEQHLQDIPMSKFQILKNVVAVSFGFLFLFTSFQSLTNLQSTLNKDEGIGTGGLSIIYGTLDIYN